MWCIEELGLSYERIDAGFKYGVTDTEDYLAMNPNGTVPTIKDGEQQPLWESSAILRYLAGQYGNDSFWPNDPASRSKIDQWAEWAKINIALNFTSPIFWQVVRTPKNQQNPEAIHHAVVKFESAMAIANQQLEKQPYLAGQSFTLADIQFGHVLYRYFDIPIKRAIFDNIARYYQLIAERPAFKAHVAVSYQELYNSK